MSTRSAKRRESASSAESDWVSESAPSTSHVSVTTAQTTRRNTGSVYSDAQNSISSRSSSRSGSKSTTSSKHTQKEIKQDTGPIFTTTEIQTDDEFMYKNMQASLDSAYEEMKAKSTAMDINLAMGRLNLDDLHMMFLDERRQKILVEKKYQLAAARVQMLKTQLNRYIDQEKTGVVTERVMKALKNWDREHVVKNKLARKSKFMLTDAEADVIGLENTLRFILRVSAGYDDGSEYLRRVLPVLRRQIQMEPVPLETVGEVGVKALIRLMSMYQGDAKIQEELCMMLNILLAEDQGPCLTKYGISDAVITAMAIHQGNVTILEWGLECLLGLAQSGPEVRAELLRQPDESTSYENENSDSVEFLANAINQEDAEKVPISLQGVITMVLTNNYKIRNLTALSLAIIYTLLREEERMKEDIEHTAIPALVMQAHKTHPTMELGGVFGEQRHWLSVVVKREAEKKKRAEAKARKKLGFF
eukprot:CAMPEP_0118925722 /NCGR_PEP_ID=MMETSP1169-20130426/3563_1 /TAXON_ID=36882 /ORGANISM="Pyramimonas obovata, Strain CCMP722" /LENGTH=475 /DNA_ID=CAMNT_0006867101 /DNA_START=74 /DNA_END=1501 /DNA_ORIENTATION=+